MVKVMARTCSGSVTASSVSSLRKRWMSRPVLPEPAGASTMKERRMSRASARAEASGGPGRGAGASVGRVESKRGRKGKTLDKLVLLQATEWIGLILDFFERIGVKGRGIEAAEQTLLAVLACLGVVFGRDAGVAGVEFVSK